VKAKSYSICTRHDGTERVETQTHSFLTTLGEELRGMLHAAAAVPRGKSPPPPVTYWMGSLVGPTAGMDTLEKIKISVPWRESNYVSSVMQSIIIKQLRSSYDSVGIAALASVY